MTLALAAKSLQRSRSSSTRPSTFQTGRGCECLGSNVRNGSKAVIDLPAAEWVKSRYWTADERRTLRQLARDVTCARRIAEFRDLCGRLGGKLC